MAKAEIRYFLIKVTDDFYGEVVARFYNQKNAEETLYKMANADEHYILVDNQKQSGS